MARAHQQIRSRGAPMDDAMMAIYQRYKELERDPLQQQCSANLWFGFVRDLEAGIAGTYRCQSCGGCHIWQHGSNRFFRICMWCKAKILMPGNAVDAAIALSTKIQSQKCQNGRLTLSKRSLIALRGFIIGDSERHVVNLAFLT